MTDCKPAPAMRTVVRDSERMKVDRVDQMNRLRPMSMRTALKQFNKPWLGAVFVFVLALSLRTCGLSHDLHHERIYHPDTPKQIRAAERFIDGEYYTIIGGRDYEGYPYFNSHLVALAYRAYDSARHQVRTHLGLPFETIAPNPHALHWATRLMNAFWSALAALVICLAGMRFFNPATGLIAGLLLAVSPIDITAAHFAAGDSATGFFATCAVVAALGIARSGKWWLYIAAALLTGAAFSTKYHGGMALIAALVAHLFRYPHPRQLFSGPSIGRGAVLGIALLLGILVTSPALLVYPESAFKDILQFVEYTSSFGMTREMAELPLWSRFLLGMRINLPVLADVLGPVLVAAILLAIVIGFKKPETWVLASLPMAYILIGLATKPLTHAVYHTLATPALTLLGAVAIAHFFHVQRRAHLARVAGLILLAFAFVYSANYAHRELFFFRHSDTRHLSESWALDNIPRVFLLRAGPYTFNPAAWESDPERAPAIAHVMSDRQRVQAPPSAFLIHAVTLEEDKLTVFRNWNQYCFLPESEYLRPGFRRPGYQPFPSPRRDHVLFADAPWWVRTPKVRDIRDGDQEAGTLVSSRHLDQAAWLVRAGEEPAHLRLAFGGRRARVRLEPNETRVIPVKAPRATFMTRNPNRFYPWRIRGNFGHALVHLATTPDEIAWALFNTGAYADAFAAFQAIAADQRSAGDIPALRISALASGNHTPEFIEFDDPPPFTGKLLDDFGVSERFFELLPAMAFGPQTLKPYLADRARKLGPDAVEETFEVADPEHRAESDRFTHFSQTPVSHFEPGHYAIRLDRSEGSGPIRIQILDAWDRPIQRDHVVTGSKPVSIAFVADNERDRLRVRIWGDRASLLTLEQLHIRPDPAATMQSYASLARMMTRLEFPDDDLNPLMYWPLVHMGNRFRERTEWENAYTVYAAAIRADPDRLQAHERLTEIAPHLPDELEAMEALLTPYRETADVRAVHPAHARLGNGMILNGYQISQRVVRPGEEFGLNLFWEIPRLHGHVRRHAAWVHVIREGERKPTFFGDHHLLSAVRVTADHDRLRPAFMKIRVPEDAPLGTYTLKTGLWIPAQRRNIRVAESSHPHDRRGVFLGEIEVVE